MTQKEYEEGYAEFIRDVSEHCHCCPMCNDTPCDDVLAGGICFGSCSCDEEDDHWCDDEY